jgi:hypothetical protein
MAHGDLAIVERWLASVNEANREAVLALTASDLEIVGPRGVGRGKALLADWLARAGFAAEARRWFCGEGGRVVVEQDATWSAPDGGAGHAGHARVASSFVVRDRLIARFERFDSLAGALAGAGLAERDEVCARA